MTTQPFPACTRLERLASTAVSDTWRVSLTEPGGPTRLATLREDQPGARRLGLDRVSEPAVIQAAAAAGIGPALLAADPDHGRLLTQWVPGCAWQTHDLQSSASLQKAAQLLRRLHATPLQAPSLNLENAIQRYASITGPSGAGQAAEARGAMRACSPLPVSAWCFCHNDPTPGNFIAGSDGVLHLIDWEYAGLCDPAFDLAGLAAGADLAVVQSRLLLDSYFGRPASEPEITRHLAWQRFCQALATLWQCAIDVLHSHRQPDPAGSQTHRKSVT